MWQQIWNLAIQHEQENNLCLRFANVYVPLPVKEMQISSLIME